ncbi:MAG: antibiotic biosynthesis monooxygenase [Fimbriiglobus sp.]|nr:antibiotic biosynthesis monooxygenase [Fimbriiglobus sp.]
MIHVLATIDIAPGKRAEFLTHFAWVTPLVRAEAGCIEYGAAVDIASGLAVQPPLRPDAVVVVEKWKSLQHLKDHLTAPHMAEYRVRVKELVTAVSLQVLEPA